MRILSASAELAPLAQSGGLGDAVSGLAHALAARGHDITCVIPGYRSSLAAYASLPGTTPLVDDGDVTVAFLSGDLRCRWLRGLLAPGVTVCFLDAPALYDRPSLYGQPDDALRFIAFSRAVGYRCDSAPPEILLAHDWHSALAICVLRTALDRGPNRAIGTVQVIHNNAYQGLFPLEAMALTGLASELFHPEGLEAWGRLCLLKGGIHWADRIVAVSPTYAEEIQTPEFGAGLEGAYRARAHRLCGIANGIDIHRFDPGHDSALPEPFDALCPSGKRHCREAMAKELGLREPGPGRLCAAIGRFAKQKGWDVLAAALDGLVADDCSVALLGDGEPEIAAQVRDAAARHPGRVAVRVGYDEALARRLYGGADCVLIPSRFEPCGLVQRIAQRYGAVPVAHRVGGLADTIDDPEFEAVHLPRKPATSPARRATGILFAPLTAAGLVEAVARVAHLGDRGQLEALQRRLLRLDVSWARPAARWEKILETAVYEAKGRL
ncbi:MAG TPA: glycogen/starch synthase [Myxococcota bacterium]|nr:glycogen/starch synthase [Myxococcota bacterium]